MKTLEQPKCWPLLSPSTTSVATESVCAHSDTNIGWEKRERQKVVKKNRGADFFWKLSENKNKKEPLILHTLFESTVDARFIRNVQAT